MKRDVLLGVVSGMFLAMPSGAGDRTDGPIVACAHKFFGWLRVVSDESRCTRRERPIRWNREGPPGPPGDPGVGARLFLASTGSAVAVEGGPATVVPGLEAELSVAEASSLAIQVDARDYASCEEFLCCGRGRLIIRLDGETVASRFMPGLSIGNAGVPEDYGVTFLSPPLPAGTHSVALLVDAIDDGDGRVESTGCVGRGGGADDVVEARMTVIELRQ